MKQYPLPGTSTELDVVKAVIFIPRRERHAPQDDKLFGITHCADYLLLSAFFEELSFVVLSDFFSSFFASFESLLPESDEEAVDFFA